MTPSVISGIVFGCIFGGALAGMIVRRLLPEHHLSAESRDVVKLGMGLIATMAALVLGLLVASAKSSFDAQKSGLTQLSANIILLDRVLAHYGPETSDARALLRGTVVGSLERLWPEAGSSAGQVQPTAASESLYEKIQELTPKNESQRTLQAQAVKTGIDVAQTRWLLFSQRGTSIPTPFLVVLVFWLTIIFAQLQPVRFPQCHGGHDAARLCIVGRRRHLPDSGVGPAVCRRHSNFQRPLAGCAWAARPIAPIT
jgi:hypothetical protein